MDNDIERLEIKMVNNSAAMCEFPNKQCFRISTAKAVLLPRDIRVMQLAMMLKGQIISSFEEAEKQLVLMNGFSNEAIGEIIKEFKIYDFSDQNVIKELSSKIIEVLENERTAYCKTEKNEIERFLVSKYVTVDENIEIKTLKEIGIHKYNVLEYSKIVTVKDLMEKSEQELLEIRAIGSAAIQDIKEKLKEVGLELKKNNQ